MIDLATLLGVWALVAMLAYETFHGSPRYKRSALLLLSDRAAAEVERAIRSRNRAGDRAFAIGEARDDEDREGGKSLPHVLHSAVRRGR